METEIIKVKQEIMIDWSKEGQLFRSIKKPNCIPNYIVMSTGEHDTSNNTFEGIIIIADPTITTPVGTHFDCLMKEDYELITEPLLVKFTPDPPK